MRNLFFLLLLFSISAYGQKIAERKIVGFSLMDVTVGVGKSQIISNGVTSNTTTGLTISLAPGVEKGFINKKNVAVLWGIQIPFLYNHNKPAPDLVANETHIGLFPSISIMKMIPVTEKVFFGTMFGAKAGCDWENSNATATAEQHYMTIKAGVSIVPVTVTWFFKPSTALLFGVGYYELAYSHLAIVTPNLPSNKYFSNNVGLNGHLSTITVGIRFLVRN